ncbi:hypothetical protein FACUT_10836 [Fusarium acutatum]|uniref:Uncharacterized protein n=1 Tax=Fusarium acutatum TaxID=78861 RepID=A0A8H4JEU9_9HYPO|nr:hypothetical protein FACUT_10836 [Fusarium acutatum]
MSLSPIQAQWAIDETSRTFLSTVTGVLAAAASDNVQALAIVACEQFGSTLAICDETSHKVETVIVPTPQPATVLFLKAAVGYSPRDSATQLGKSMTGVRFLGLAAALATSFDLFNCARALNVMLRSSASDLTMVPTARQLKDLLASLQPRSYRAGFSESVVGWQIMLQKEAMPRILTDRGHLGESTITGATIKTGAAAAWVAAFIKWCLGLPPSIYMEGNQQLLRQPGSVVTLVIPKTLEGLRKGLEITVHDSLDHLGQLIAPPSTRPFSGMATIENYGRWLLESFGLRGTSLRALHEALDFLIPKALGALTWSEFDLSGQEAYPAQLHHRVDTSVGGYTLHPLPDTRKIADVYSKLLSPARTPRLTTTDNHMLIADLPLVSQYLESLSQACPCSQCCGEIQGHVNLGRTFCKQDEFFEFISFITVDILVLSLFRSLDLLLIKLSHERDSNNALQRAIFRLAKAKDTAPRFKAFETPYAWKLLEWARSMVGHKVSAEDEDGNTIVTSGYGQVIYPTLFDTLDIERRGYMGLTSYQGVLIYEGETYQTVTTDTGDSAQDELLELNSSCPTQVSVPLNAFPDLEVFWNVGIQDSRELSIALSVRSRTVRLSLVRMHPMDLFFALEKTLLIERCPHDGRTGINPTDRFCSHNSPLDSHQEACNSYSHVDVIPLLHTRKSGRVNNIVGRKVKLCWGKGTQIWGAARILDPKNELLHLAQLLAQPILDSSPKISALTQPRAAATPLWERIRTLLCLSFVSEASANACLPLIPYFINIRNNFAQNPNRNVDMADPLSIIETARAIANIIDALTKTIKTVCDMRQAWKVADQGWGRNIVDVADKLLGEYWNRY